MSKVMRFTLVAALVAAVVPMQQAAAASADEIVSKYIEAVGGADAINKIKSRKTVGKFSLPDMGLEAPMTTIVEGGNMWSEVNIESMGMIVLRGLTDGVAWEVNPMNGPSILEGSAAAAMVRQATIEPWLNWKDYYTDAKVEGDEAVGDATATKVVFTPKEGDPETYYFDTTSGLIIQTEAIAEGMTMTGTISEYKEVDGVKTAVSIEQAGGAMGTVIISFETIENNIDVEDDLFALPEEIKALQGG